MSVCPCTLVTPCQPSCSCANEFLSGGCDRCASYGSKEQQLAAAVHIAGREATIHVHEFTIRSVSTQRDKAQRERDEAAGLLHEFLAVYGNQFQPGVGNSERQSVLSVVFRKVVPAVRTWLVNHPATAKAPS